jgi:hypothetical protein
MAKRKKNKIKAPAVDVIPEYEGWKVGDEAWFCVGSEATPHHGKIENFFPGDSIAPAVSLQDTAGGHRVTLVEFIFSSKKEAKDSRPDYAKFWEDYKNKKKEKQ